MNSKLSRIMVDRWLKSSIYSGERLLEVTTKEYEYFDQISGSDQRVVLEVMKKLNEETHISFFYQQSFISSINQMRDWMKESLNYDAIFESILSEFDALFPNVRDVRNMNEHSIAYFKAQGYKQGDFVLSWENEDGRKHISDATGISISRNSYTIGGRLKVQEVLLFLKETLPIVDEILKNRTN